MEQENIDIKRLKFFTRWLKENGIYRAYCNAYKDENAINKPILIRDTNFKHLPLYMHNRSWRDIVTLSFVWDNTPQGHEFWHRHYINFKAFYDENYKLNKNKN